MKLTHICKLIVESNMAMETSKTRDHSSKKRIPKRINKAEREKIKRDNLNELFLALTTSLELSNQNNGKVSVLIEATRMVKDMLTQIKCLKKENAALLSESQYIMVEKNELRDENSSLAAEIGELQREIDSKVSELQLDLNISPPECRNQEALHSKDGLMLSPLVQDGQIVHPLRLAALCSNSQSYSEVGTGQLGSKHAPVVRKPHARYPTPADQWPLQVLEPRPELG
ncbi:hypothetical protein ACS0TY_006874 [Phlomoides rotata]